MYQTPELLLVGAAQHLVLGNSVITVDTANSTSCVSFPNNTDVHDGQGMYHDTALW
jgi:hypothetical protein